MEILRIPAVQPCARTIQVPGDKSITHRALLLSAIASGKTTLERPNLGADTLATAYALRQLGVSLDIAKDRIVVEGANDFRDPKRPLDCGNSGTTMRLLMGLLAGRVNAVLDGDESLRRRPMERLAKPLRQMGALIETVGSGTPPVTLRRSDRELQGVRYRLTIPSAQIKSAILLAGLHATRETTVICLQQTRDHTERMLHLMHANFSRRGNRLLVRASRLESPGRIDIPGDFSAAFFFICTALATPGAQLHIQNVGVNPTRTAALAVLRRMGGNVTLRNRRLRSNEPVADIYVSGGTALQNVAVDPSVVPNLIDEVPALCALAATASGTFVIHGAAELRVKESDRIATTVELLRSFGADARALPDGITVRGGRPLRAPKAVDTYGDHRIGMAATILAAAAGEPITIKDARCIATSFPGFETYWKAAFGEKVSSKSSRATTAQMRPADPPSRD